MISYDIETYDQIIGDIKPLLRDHWQELALYKDDIPLDPDFAKYKMVCDSETMRLYSVRKDGALVGYAIYAVVARHLHYNHRWAVNDIIWIHPDHRNMGVGNGLFDFIEDNLRVGGPTVISTETKLAHPELAGLLVSRGHSIVGQVFSKRL